MKCHVHPEVEATGTCVVCGRALCTDCQHEVDGRLRCEAHAETVPAPPEPPPLPSIPEPAKAPGLAFFLGLAPGIGHLYLGLPKRAISFAGSFFLAIVLASEISPIFMIAVFFIGFFSAFDSARLANVFNRRGGWGGPEVAPEESFGRPGAIAGVVLIAIGILAWLHVTWDIDLAWLRDQWPLGVVLVGAYLLFGAVRERAEGNDGPPTA